MPAGLRAYTDRNANFGDEVIGTLTAGALGGIGSALGGGKFANGAVTGAFAYAASAVLKQDGEIELHDSTSGSSVDYTNVAPAGLQAIRSTPDSGLAAAEKKIWGDSFSSSTSGDAQ